MANLGDNNAFLNETTFTLGDKQTEVTGVSGIIVSDGSAAKVLFNKLPSENFSTSFVTTSAYVNDIAYMVQIDGSYDGQILSIINANRVSTQFQYSSSNLAFQAVTATGVNSVGPTLRRLYQLGYV